ncbi:unnamed protein product [Thelazia callipaeda]|uniref:Exonuclease domain-containing protein n=1 Tax=Thelazia callipaeda TaxID=103827 RepID=A0A0N5D2P8_THECL|nr:unnamed protein product [Thelazia callipaeda]
MRKYYCLLDRAVGNSNKNYDRNDGDNKADYDLPIVRYEKPLQKNAKHVIDVMKRLHFMTTVEMHRELKKAHIDSSGNTTQLYKRLKKYFRKELAIIRSNQSLANKTHLLYKYLVVVDFECTCDSESNNYDHEIIEFPAVLIDVRKKSIVNTSVSILNEVDIFHSYVRPVHNPQLTEFCSKLTGITQEMVDSALPFVDVLDSFRTWMQMYCLGEREAYFAFVTDGPWDIAKFLQMQCIQSQLDPVPHEFRAYINIRKSFANKYCRGRSIPKINLTGMLTALNMTFEGREHCGLDDSKNIARIVIKMIMDRSEIRINEKLVRVKENEKETMLPLEMSREDRDRLAWKDNLPYRVHQISRESFISDEYLDCDTCDENQ